MDNIRYFAYVKDDVLSNGGACPLIAEGLYNVEISEEIYNNLDHYMAVKHEEEDETKLVDVEGESVPNVYYEIVLNPDYEAEELEKAKEDKNAENTQKAKAAVENGYVEYKNAQFETNAQTVGDLTATMLLMQASGLESYTWLSKDDKEVELTLADFGTLGGLIAGYKAHIWNDEYLSYKEEIEAAQTLAELSEIEIIY